MAESARNTYVVERSTNIDATPAAVYGYLVDFHRWVDWSPWEDLDPKLHRTYSGAEGGVGATYAWRGNRKAGEGRMEITAVEPDRSVTVDLRFLKPFKSTSESRFTLVPADSSTRVTWTMTGKQTFMLKVMGIFTSMDKLVGKDFEKGLRHLKALVES